MARAPELPSIVDSPSAQRAVIGAGALLAAVGAAFFFAEQNDYTKIVLKPALAKGGVTETRELAEVTF